MKTKNFIVMIGIMLIVGVTHIYSAVIPTIFLDEKEFIVIGVKQIESGGIVSTTATPGAGETLYIAKGATGATITITALPDPITANWPTDFPVWSGTGVIGNGATATIPIDVVSSTADGATVTATCGASSKAMKIVVVGVEIDGLKIYDPKLKNAGNAEIKYKVDGPVSGFSPRVELSVMDGNTEVTCLVRKTEASPAWNTEITKTWDGKWGVKKDGSDTDHKGLFADSKKYTVELSIFLSETSPNSIITKKYDLYVVRLGLKQIAFADDQELAFHKTGPAAISNFTFTDKTDFSKDIVWQLLDNLDFDRGANQIPRTEAKREVGTLGESFNDDNNDGICNTGENYLNEDGNGTWTSNLRQANYPDQIPTVDKDVSGGVNDINFNRPVVYVSDSKINIKIKFGDNSISDLTVPPGNVISVGYPVTDYPIEVRPSFNGAGFKGFSFKKGDPDIRNISQLNGPYILESINKLADTVGLSTELIEFRFRYNATGESFIDLDGDDTWDSNEEIINDNKNKVFDAVWKDIPGTYTTSHLIYRIAAAPTHSALEQYDPTNPSGDRRLFVKILDFTCDWAATAGSIKTPAQVFNTIWEGNSGNNFWTHFTGVPPLPDNSHADAFHGIGDEDERIRTDDWGHNPKCYTYEHDMADDKGFDVNWLLDYNQGRCGAWAKFLVFFAGSHGYPVQVFPIEILYRFVETSTGNTSYLTETELLTRLRTGSVNIGDLFYIPAGLLVKNTIDAQANPKNQTYLEPAFTNHAVTYVDTNKNGTFDGTEKLFDPSYDHSSGASLNGYISLNDLENASVDTYYYGVRFKVISVGPPAIYDNGENGPIVKIPFRNEIEAFSFSNSSIDCEVYKK